MSERIGGVAIAEEACVECAFEEALGDLGGVGLVKLEVDPGVCSAVLAEHGGQRGQHAGADEAYAEEAFFAATDTAGLVEVFLNVLQGAAGAVEKSLAGAGEFDGAGGAGEEGVAEDVFELANLLGERRLGDVKAVGGTAEVELLGYGDEVAEVA
jgi:hypothetical protein